MINKHLSSLLLVSMTISTHAMQQYQEKRNEILTAHYGKRFADHEEAQKDLLLDGVRAHLQHEQWQDLGREERFENINSCSFFTMAFSIISGFFLEGMAEQFDSATAAYGAACCFCSASIGSGIMGVCAFKRVCDRCKNRGKADKSIKVCELTRTRDRLLALQRATELERKNE